MTIDELEDLIDQEKLDIDPREAKVCISERGFARYVLEVESNALATG